MSGTPVHVWPHPGLGTSPPGPHVQKGDKIHIAPHLVHGTETGHPEADITVTDAFPVGDAVMICGKCGDGACRSVVYEFDALVERLDVAA